MKIGLLGTGLMGEAMVLRLLNLNIPVIAYNRTFSKLNTLQEAGAEITNSVIEIINQADKLILMLTDVAAIRSVLFTENKHLLHGKTIISMATISPDESQEIAQEIVSLGGEYLEAPVLGSIPEARIGKLLVMVGATTTQFQQNYDFFQYFTDAPKLVGEVGTASALKLGLNQLIAGLTASFALSLGFIKNQGVKVEDFMEILRESALYAPTFDKKLQRMQEQNYENPNFPTKHLLKDTDLFLRQATAIGQNTLGLQGVREIIQQAMELGLADGDYSAIYTAINQKL
jgi:3-hydroxyisobutyrate dehydrogenase